MRRLLRSGTFWFSVAVVVVLGVGAGLSAGFWGDLSTTPNGTSESLSTTVRNVMLMMGGLLALPLAIWRGWVAERQVKATQKSVDAAQEAIANQRFQAAAEMLGHHSNAVRLGAIHTLGALAREVPERYYVDTVTLLAAFIRNPPDSKLVTAVTFDGGFGTKLREDEAAALKLIGSRTDAELALEARREFQIDLSDRFFEGWDLREMNLERVLFHDAFFRRANLGDANLSYADLSRCFFGGASFRGANIRQSVLSETRFSAWSVNREGEYSGRREESQGVVGLTQSQLDEALDDQDNPPKLKDVRDADAGDLLSWHGIPPEQL